MRDVREQRALAIGELAVGPDGGLRVAALIDIQRRPASQIRGRKGMWAAAVALVSSAGVVPLSYFVFGQRREP